MMSCPLFQNAFILKGSRVTNFADIIKNGSTFLYYNVLLSFTGRIRAGFIFTGKI